MIFAFLQNISSYYLTSALARAQCVQAQIAAVDDNCNVPGATADAEQFFREVMAGSLIAASGRSEYSRVANDFGYYLRDLGAAAGPAAALSDLRAACDAAYLGSLRIACQDEMTLRLTRSLAEGGFGGLSADDAERMGRGRTCLDHVDDIEEFCGRSGGQ